MTQQYKLYSPAGSFRALAPLIAAEYNGIDIEVVSDNLEERIAQKSPIGKAPLLECVSANGNSYASTFIFSSQAIARYIAGLRNDNSAWLLGSTQKERMAIDEWMDWTALQVELPACVLFYPVLGMMPKNDNAQQQAKRDWVSILQLLETYLSKQQQPSATTNTTTKYLVYAQHISLADIVVVCTLLYPFQLVCDPEYLRPYSHVVQWFQNCVQQVEFVRVVGDIKLFNG